MGFWQNYQMDLLRTMKGLLALRMWLVCKKEYIHCCKKQECFEVLEEAEAFTVGVCLLCLGMARWTWSAVLWMQFNTSRRFSDSFILFFLPLFLCVQYYSDSVCTFTLVGI